MGGEGLDWVNSWGPLWGITSRRSQDSGPRPFLNQIQVSTGNFVLRVGGRGKEKCLVSFFELLSHIIHEMCEGLLVTLFPGHPPSHPLRTKGRTLNQSRLRCVSRSGREGEPTKNSWVTVTRRRAFPNKSVHVFTSP